MPSRRAVLTVGAIVLLVLVGALAEWSYIRSNPKTPFLFPEGGAEWIRYPRTVGPEFHGAEDFMAAYRTTFTLEKRPEKTVLFVRPYRYVEVYIDGALVGNTGVDLENWTRRFGIDLTGLPLLTPGTHELFLSVLNRTGPPIVLAYSDDLGIYTGKGWETRDHESDEWVPAISIAAPQVNTVGEQLPRADRVFLAKLPLFIGPFLLVFAWTLLATRPQGAAPWLRRATPDASGIRWILLCAWAVLISNNIVQLPYGVGFDIAGHLEYMMVIARKGYIPYAFEGWQMFQSPLYYIICAPLYTLFAEVFTEAKVTEALRIVPMICGAFQIQMSYLVMQKIQPNRQDLQALGTLLGGFLPINLYLSQNLANEPLVALLSSLIIFVSLGLLLEPDKRWSTKTFGLLGFLLGLALLTKITVVVLCLPLVLLIAYVAYIKFPSTGKAILPLARSLVVLFGVAFVVCGWYFIRNWLEMGRPFVGGWDESRGYIWWQEPGYRTIEQYTTFGQALTYPIYSAVHGYWDGVYSTLWLDGFVGSATDLESTPMWNFNFLLTSAWWSVVPTVLLLVGAVLTLARPQKSARNGHLFALMCIAILFASMAQLSLRIPVFSTLKSTYMLGVTTCYAMVFAAGCAPFLRFRVARALIYATMTCWALSVYAGYFVVGD